jgi:uncharacterized glyoxalase superfamily protein PhnB
LSRITNPQHQEDIMAKTMLQAQNLGPALTVNDVERSFHFYTEGLGFAVSQKMEDNGKLQGALLTGGGAKLGLSQDDFAKGRDRVKGVGMSLYVETDQDLKALAEQAKAAGITLDGEPAPLPWGPMAFTVTDPDGFKLTFMNPG